LRDLRDNAILMGAFAPGGRRRSEIARLRVEQLTIEPSIEMLNSPSHLTICTLIRSDLLHIKAIMPTALAIAGHSLHCRRPSRYCSDPLHNTCGI